MNTLLNILLNILGWALTIAAVVADVIIARWMLRRVREDWRTIRADWARLRHETREYQMRRELERRLRELG